MKTKSTHFKKIYLLLFFCVLSIHSVLNAQTVIDCHCTAGDTNVLKVELVSSNLNPTSTGDNDKYLPLGSSCSMGDNLNGLIKFTISQNATTRYGTNIYADVYINNAFLKTIHTCNPAQTTGDFVIYLDAAADLITWSCATNITLKNVFLGWGNSSGNNACTGGNDNNRCYTSPHCSKNASETNYVVITPLNASFNTTSTCVGNNELKDITFTSTSTGGTTPYQYKWVIFDGTTTTTIDYSANNSYTYTPTNNHDLDVTLYVKDSSNPQKNSSISQTGIAVGTCCTTPVITNKTANICSNTSFNINPTTGGGDTVPAGTTYTWTTPVSNPVGAITGGTSQATGITGPISQTLINGSTNSATLTYTVIPKSGSCTGIPFNIVVTVKSSFTLGASNSTNVSCFGMANGSASVGTIIGSTGTINYIWKNSSNVTVGTNATVNNLPPGTYTVTVTDDCSSKSNSVTITQPEVAVSVSGIVTNATCFGQANGSIAVTSSQGSTVVITNEANQVVTNTNLPAGIYTLTASAPNGNSNGSCTAIAQVTITQPTAALSASITSQTDVLCFGNNTASVTVAGANGTAPYTYSKDGITFVSSGVFSGLIAGNYTITVKDANACATTQAVTITQPTAALSASITSQTNVLCFGNNTASVTVAGANGTAPYSYSKDGITFVSSGVFNGLIAGNYTITVKDANACATTQAVTITQPTAALSASITSQTNVLCFGNNTASVTVAGANGTAPYTYSKDGITFVSSGVFSGLIAGNYTITVKDANACTTTQAVTITQPTAALSASITSQTNVLCFGNNTASVTVAGANGTAAYSYSKDGITFVPSGVFSGLIAGAYTITVKDANACTTTQAVTITQPTAALSASITSQTDVLCFGNNTASVTVAGANGTTPYTYSKDGITFVSSGVFSGLIAGAYTITVKDANACTTTQAVTITQPTAALSASISSQTDVLCFGNNTASVTVAGANGTAPYSYSKDGITFVSSGVFSGLIAGNYTITVKDANACTTTQAVNITQPTAALSASISSQTDVLCFGNNTASVTVAGANGTAPYSYSKDGITFVSSGVFSGLIAGNYTITVKDANACTTTQAVIITQPTAALSASITSQTNVLCFGNNTASVTVAGANGTAPYTYSKDGITFVSSGVFSGLIAENYTITVKDANACTTTQAVSITQPTAALSASITSQTNVLCFGNNNASVTVAGANGTAPYTYSKDATTFVGSGEFSELIAGTYTITVKDANGCTTTQAVSITQPTAALSASITSQTNVLCFGNNNASVTVAGANGTAPYTYSKDGITFVSSGVFSGLIAGAYTITVKDANACTTTQAVTITQPTAGLSASITSQTNVLCFGNNTASVTVAGTNGTAPYSYSKDGITFVPSGVFSGLIAGAYTITVKDANACTATQAVTITQPTAALSASITSQTDVLCFGNNTASVTVAGTNGTAPYTYSKDGITFVSSGVFSGLIAGNYTITVKDANACTTTQAVIITQPTAALSASITSQTNVLCFGNNTASVTVAGTNGTAPYTYSKDGITFVSSGVFSGLIAGNYTITVKDANACTTTQAVIITQPTAALSASITSQTNVLCFGNNTASVTVAGANGTAPYTYSKDGITFVSSGVFSGLIAGNYTITVKDANACTTTQAVIITQPTAALSASITSQTDVLCFGNNTASVTVAGTNGTAPYTYSKDGITFVSSGVFSGLIAGNYTITVKDANACTTTQTITITQPTAALSASITSQTNVLCFGNNNASVTVAGANGTAPYTYSKDATTFVGSGEFSELIAGTYTITVKDANECTTTQAVTISEPEVTVSVSGIATNVCCFGKSDGSIAVTNSAGSTVVITNEANQVVSNTNLPAGIYTLTASAPNGNNNGSCTATSQVTITQPEVAVSVSGIATNVCCFGKSDGSIAVTNSVGSTVVITNEANQVVSNTNLPAGIYTLTASAPNGNNNGSCTATAQVTITQPEVAVSVSGIATNTICFGESNGSIAVTNSAGSTVVITNEANQVVSNTNLPAGIYSLTASAPNGNNNGSCTATSQVTITQPEVAVSVSGIATNVCCFGKSDGSIAVTNSVGSTVVITNEANQVVSNTNLPAGIYTLTASAPNGNNNGSCTATSQVTITQPEVAVSVSGIATNATCFGESNGSIAVTNSQGSTVVITNEANQVVSNNNLPAGIYTLTASAPNGNNNGYCIATAQVTISQPTAPLSATAVIINNNNCTNCNNGSINLSVTGGTDPYTFLWSNGATSEDISNLTKGIYSVEIKDKNGCKSNYTFEIYESSINITKDGNYVDTNQDGITNVGDVVTYNFVIKNTGNLTLTNINVTDNNAVITGGPITTLTAGSTDSTTFSGSHIITQNDINIGYVYNLAIANAKDPEDKTVIDTSSDPTPCTTCPIEPECTNCTITILKQTPGLTVLKTTTTESFSKVGDIINYSIIIKNTGNLTLHQIVVKDPLTGLDTTIATLEPNASSVYLQSYTVTQQDLNKGSVTNVATANGLTPSNNPISATDDEIVNEKTNPIDAVNDNAGTVVGVNQITPNVINVFTNDTLNTLAVNPTDVILTTVTSNPYLQLNPNGSIDVLPDAPVGTQTMTYQICEKLNNTNCDTATVTVIIQAPTMKISGEAICINDVPYFNYTATADNFTPVNGLTLTWSDSNNNIIATMPNLPLTGRILWPGATVDQNGNGTDWPGWVFENGKWSESADGFQGLRPNATITFTLNPSQVITVNYPPSDPFCTSRPTFKIDAVNDTAGPINGINGATNVLNVLNNDTLNTVAVNPADVKLTLVTPDPTGFMTMNPNGSIDLKNSTPAGIYTLVYQICEIADNGNCDSATVTITVICNNTTKIDGVVFNAATNAPLANVPVTLVPQGTTTGPILIRITNAQGQYNFTGVIPGDYLVQVQDANLNSAYQLYPVDSSLFFTTLENCKYQAHNFAYDKSDLPVLGDFVWYDINNNGIQDEWFDANNDNLVTKNIPDANGSFDYSKWEWIDLNGDGSYKGPLNVGELNAAGFGNAKSPNIFVTGPNNYNKSVIIGIQGFWRNRPDAGVYGDYKVELKMDANLEAQSSAMSATGLVKVLPKTNKTDDTKKTSKSAKFEVCGPTNANPQTATLTATNQVNLDIDFGISCKMFANIQATSDTYNVTQCSIANEIRNALSNDLLDGLPANINDFKFKLLTSLPQNVAIDLNANVSFVEGVSPGQYILDYQVCEAANPTNCSTAKITINVAGITPIMIASTACNADTSLIDLKKLLPEGFNTNGSWIDTDKTGVLVGNTFNALGIPLNNYKFEYKIGDNCPSSVILTMSINDDCKVLPCNSIIVHNAVSANEDGKNDYFQIENLENDCYKNFKVEIYNRWGILIFERENYNNEGNAFRGRSEGRTTINKNEGLPTGTYFYILNYDTVDGEGKTINIKKDGYLYLVK
ncbi:DUF7507 domain-containing protein [Flavobacterium sp. WC2509]|uniref:DUF7507 domain-containing protein n=1 Tax=Flavobacterium sp. WC2509 TaxID=3461406 RepID=UPI004044944E